MVIDQALINDVIRLNACQSQRQTLLTFVVMRLSITVICHVTFNYL